MNMRAAWLIAFVATAPTGAPSRVWVRLFCIHQFRTCLPIVSTIATRILTFWCCASPIF
jgi:hypothetical protein